MLTEDKLQQSREKSNNALPLFPDHLQKLKTEYGLIEETIWGEMLNNILHRTDITCGGIVIPYDEGSQRVRLDVPQISRDGKEAKYLAASGSKNQLYIPGPVKAVLQDPSIPISFTEGEFKSLKATQEGFPCIGLAGAHGFLSNGQFLDDFSEIEFKNREVVIALDSDAQLNQNVLKAGHRLTLELARLGGRPKLVILPKRGRE